LFVCVFVCVCVQTNRGLAPRCSSSHERLQAQLERRHDASELKVARYLGMDNPKAAERHAAPDHLGTPPGEERRVWSPHHAPL
jgi:hypothetical protein